jgi:uncharacterized membrane protein
MWAGVMIGVGVMAAVDEIVFHQLLAWHSFYDRAGGTVGLISDGVLHAAELFLLIAGFFLLASTLRRGTASPGAALAGLFLGAGGFQLFDGLINHKVLGSTRSVRRGRASLRPGLDAAALALLLLGAVLAGVVAFRRRRSGSGTRTARPDA